MLGCSCFEICTFTAQNKTSISYVAQNSAWQNKLLKIELRFLKALFKYLDYNNYYGSA